MSELSTDQFERRDVVSPVPGSDPLVSWASLYPYAIVWSVYPFVLVSEEGDMVWYHEKPEDHRFERRATNREWTNVTTRMTGTGKA